MRLSTHEIQHILGHYPVEIQEIFLGVRDLVFETVPDAWERYKMNGVAYFVEENSSPLKGMICHVVPRPEFVEIGFIFGAFMPDPENLLEGTQKAKRKVLLQSYDTVRWKALGNLIKAAAEIDPAAFS